MIFKSNKRNPLENKALWAFLILTNDSDGTTISVNLHSRGELV